MRRWPALALIVGLLVAALVFDQRTDTERSRRAQPAPSSGAVELAQHMPVSAPADALSSTWFCAGGTAEPDGIADHAVVVSNPTDRRTVGTITAVPSSGGAVTQPLELEPFTRTRVTLSDLVVAPYAAAEVEMHGGIVSVEHEVSGPLEIDAAPCASTTSSTWHFASGVTTPNATETLVVFNPFLDAATVDITFATPQGTRRPGGLQGLGVPGRSVMAVSVNDPEIAPVNDQVSTTVATRTGRVVVDRIQTFDGETATTTDEQEPDLYRPRGLAINLGVPQPATAWMFPVGLKDEGVHERYVVYNPNEDDAEVDLAVLLADPEINGEIDPFSVTVPGGSYQVIEMDEESRVPTRVDHSTVVLSTNGVGIVVDRMLAFERPFVAQGTAASSGTPLVAPTWTFASGGNVPDRLSQRIAVHNPSDQEVTVTVEVMAGGRLAPIEGVGPVTLGPHGHQFIRFADRLDDRQVSVVVTASAPIAAERLLFRIGEPGLSTAMGIPGAEGLAEVPATAAG